MTGCSLHSRTAAPAQSGDGGAVAMRRIEVCSAPSRGRPSCRIYSNVAVSEPS